MQQSISVTMIVRDEERVLARCLDSMSGIYDELIIVDTGSTDGTLKVAESYGARIVRYEGANGLDGRIFDFSAARNEALQQASCDWVLQIDADEVLVNRSAVLKNISDECAANALAVVMQSAGAEWYSARIFRRASAHRYVGRIHEYLLYDGRTQRCEGIVIQNLPDKKGKESAYDRNVRIAVLELEAGEGSSRTWHNLGNEHFREGAYAQAAKCYGTSLDLGGYEVGRFHGSLYKATCHLLLGELEAATNEALRSIAIDSAFAEAHCLLGDCLFMQDRYVEARECYLEAIARKGASRSSPLPTQPWMEEEHPRGQLDVINRIL